MKKGMKMEDSRIKEFFFPKMTTKFFVRLGIVAFAAYLFFGFICLPMRIVGISMEPVYHDGGVNFCWTPAYWFSKPKRGDVVMVKLAGNKVMFLKRVVALEDETVEFKDGRLIVNGKELNEPYVRYSCDWNLPQRKVEKNCVYVIGDNREMNIDNHQFGQAALKKVVGKPLW